MSVFYRFILLDGDNGAFYGSNSEEQVKAACAKAYNEGNALTILDLGNGTQKPDLYETDEEDLDDCSMMTIDELPEEFYTYSDDGE